MQLNLCFKGNLQPPSNFNNNSNSGPNSLESAAPIGMHEIQGPPGSLPPPDCYATHTSPAAPRPGSFPSMEGGHQMLGRNLSILPNSSAPYSTSMFNTRSPASDNPQQPVSEVRLLIHFMCYDLDYAWNIV